MPATSAFLPARCAPAAAAWGVLREATVVKALRGRRALGTVKGGRFFVVGRRSGIDGENVFVGNFTPQAIDEVVYVPQDALVCFTGSPDDLTDRQRADLRTYYELEGDIAARAAKVAHIIAERSPYAKDAAAALKQLRALQKKARTATDVTVAAPRTDTATPATTAGNDTLPTATPATTAGNDAPPAETSAADDDIRRVTYEISSLRHKVRELNLRHKEWKAQHADELPDPEKDPAIRALRQRQQPLRIALHDLLK